MTIYIPMGAETSQLTLNKVLYSPEVGYTLVSIGKLDDMGFPSLSLAGNVLFKDLMANKLVKCRNLVETCIKFSMKKMMRQKWLKKHLLWTCYIIA